MKDFIIKQQIKYLIEADKDIRDKIYYFMTHNPPSHHRNEVLKGMESIQKSFNTMANAMTVQYEMYKEVYNKQLYK